MISLLRMLGMERAARVKERRKLVDADVWVCER